MTFWKPLRAIVLAGTVAALFPAEAARAQAPAWAVDPVAFENSMNVTAALFLNGARSLNPGDVVAAFAGGEVRGVATPMHIGGNMVFFMTIYGRTGGESLSFQAYAAATARVHPIEETLTFSADAVFGAPLTPFAWNATDAPLHGLPLISPSDGEENVRGNPVLRWGTARDAATYVLQISVAASFAAATTYTGLADTVHTVYGLRAGTAYFWRVRGEGASGAGAWSAVYRFTTSLSTSAAPDPGEGEKELALDQSRPNPFGSRTRIGFVLPEPGAVEFVVFDATGREVQRLVDGVLPAGWHEATFDGDGLPRGTYYARLIVGGNSRVQPLVLLR